MNTSKHARLGPDSYSGIEVPPGKLCNRMMMLVATLSFFMVLTNTALATETQDPLISVNRAVHGFNKATDAVVFKPLARTYQKLTPKIVKKGVRNFFSNLDDVQVVINDLLQLKIRQAGSDFGRLAINSTVGMGGVFNVAGDVFGIDKHDEDFGQTLAHWGVAPGPYVVLPLLGPSTVRESFGLTANFVLNPVRVEDAGTQDKLFSVAAVDARASFLGFDELIIGDEYLFLRGMYLQRLDYKNADKSMAVSLTDF